MRYTDRSPTAPRSRGSCLETIPNVRLQFGMSYAIAHLETSIQNSQSIVNSQQFTRCKSNNSSITAVISYFKNGIKYRSQDTPIIHGSAVSQDDEWLFSVRDNEIEIVPRYSRQIYQIFQRLYSKQEYPRMEIGLTLCQTRVDNHRGRLWVESQLGQG